MDLMFPSLLGRGHDEKGLDDAFKKVTAPLGVTLVCNRRDFSQP
jgi:hypothetical protein